MEKGGYQIIDLKDVNLTTDGVIIPGIYNRIKDNNRKVILLSGITINGTPISDCFVKAIQIGTDFLLNVYGVILENELTQYDIFIEDDNTVTLQSKVVSGGGGTEVVANPTLAGTEASLTGLQVDETKYKVDSGMANPMTAAGDLIVGGTSGAPTRLAGYNHNYSRYLGCRQNTVGWNNVSYNDLYVGISNAKGKVIVCDSNIEGYHFTMGRIGSDFGLGTLTSAPTADNTDGIKIVVLSSEPATKYNGYLYIITSA